MSYQFDGPVNKRDARYDRVIHLTIDCPLVSEYTDQSFKEEADINTIMARYQSTGEMPVINQTHPQYLDVTEQDFQLHMNFILEAQALFDDLPSALRDRFGNDPGAFLGFCSDEANYDEMARLGLLSEEATTRYQSSLKPAPTASPAPANVAPEPPVI